MFVCTRFCILLVSIVSSRIEEAQAD